VQRLRLKSDHVTDEQLLPAVSAIRSGGVVAFPTDTLYGLAVDPRSASAVDTLFHVKHRGRDQAVPLIAESTRQVIEQVGTMTPLADRLASRWWPGPLTLIIPASADLCPALSRGTGKIAVRVPAHAVARALARAAGHAITATSANRSGSPPASSADAVVLALGECVDVVIDAGPAPGGPPSTIVDVSGVEPILIRAGAVPWDRVLEFLR
jgi:L-threonylcarbamoyladenylate synthase